MVFHDLSHRVERVDKTRSDGLSNFGVSETKEINFGYIAFACGYA